MPKQLSTTTKNKFFLFAFSVVLCHPVLSITPAFADDINGSSSAKASCVDWKRLSLTPQQSQQIEQLREDWNSKYMRIQPQIIALQHKLRTKFADPNADPLEIMSTQQTLARLQEELRNEAMANYLRKRALLHDNQQRQLETMMHQMVVERQQKLAPPTTQPDEQNAGLMNIIHKAKWAIEPH